MHRYILDAMVSSLIRIATLYASVRTPYSLTNTNYRQPSQHDLTFFKVFRKVMFALALRLLVVAPIMLAAAQGVYQTRTFSRQCTLNDTLRN